MGIDIDGRFLIHADEHFGFTDENGFDLAAAGARLANEGRISFRLDVDDAMLAPVLATAEDARFWNRPGALLRVDTTGTSSEAFAVEFAAAGGSVLNDGRIVVHGGQYARAITAFGTGFSLINTGVIDVSAQDAVLAFTRADTAFLNSGLMHVQGDTAAAIAVYSGSAAGSFVNHGRVLAQGVSGAVAVGLWDAGFGYALHNDGRIVATVSDAGALSRGIVLPGGGYGEPTTVENAGVLSADVAVWSIAQVNQVTIANSGVIRGAIDVNDAADHIINSGKIVGDVTLGQGYDRYDGADGRLAGDLVGGGGSDTLFGGRGNDRIWGDRPLDGYYAGADLLGGGRGDDQLVGGGGSDTLYGGQGDDTMIGGLGQDFMSGGSGASTFVFLSLADSTNDAPDHIGLFRALSLIDLSAIDADTTAGGDQAFQIVRDFTGHAGELVLTNQALPETTICGDVDGDGLADFTIVLSGWHEQATNFVL